MGEFAAKFRPEVDLDEFERRLRAAAPASHARPEGGDPLAELARLVGGESMAKKEDPFEALFRAQTAIAEIHNARHENARPEQSHPAPATEQGDFGHYSLREPYFEDQQQQPQQAPQPEQAYGHPAEAYAAEPLPYQESEPAWAPEPQAAPSGQHDWPAAFEEQVSAPPAPDFRRKVMLGMGAVLGLGVLTIGGTLALRGKSANQDVVTIQADSDPAKVKPAAADNAAAPAGQALFDRKSNANVSKVAGGSEQPADLGVTVKNARVVGGAAGVNTPAPPSPAGAPAQAQQGEAIFPVAKKVKTVSVRADGTVIDSAAAPAPAARTLPTLAAGGPPASVSAAAPSTRTPAAKTTERATSTTEAALKAPAHPHAAKPDAAKPDAAKPDPSKPQPAKVAAKEAPGGSGGFAVQLAGTPSEAEARAAVNSLSAKYSSALQGHRPSFVQAKIGDKTVYRVRVGRLTEESAKSMCTAIKTQGGNCFVAKN
jgi:hypothetical protein